MFLVQLWASPGLGIHSIQYTPSAAAKLLQSCPTLCDPIDGSPPGSPVPGILQARILEWGAISFSNAWKWKVKVKSLSRVRLLATSWTAAYRAPLSMGFSRQEYWSTPGIAFSDAPSKPSILQIRTPEGSVVKNPPAMQETQEKRVWSLGWEDPLGKETATHSSILAWEIPWTKEPGGLKSIVSQRIGHNWACPHSLTLLRMTGLFINEFTNLSHAYFQKHDFVISK